MKTNKNGVKLLAIVAVFAMVAGAFAVVTMADDSYADDPIVVTIDIEAGDGSDVVYKKGGIEYTPIVNDEKDTILITTKELSDLKATKVVVNMKGGKLPNYTGVVGYTVGTTYAGDIEFNMTGGEAGWITMTDVTNTDIGKAGASWDKPLKMAGNVVAKISGGKIATIQPVINYLTVDKYTIEVSDSADINKIRTGGSNGKIGSEQISISGGTVNIITAQRSAVGSIQYDVTGGTVNYFAIGADVEGANNNSAGEMQTGFIIGDVTVNVSESAKITDFIIGGGVLDMPIKNANGNTITDVMKGTVTINAPGKTVKMQNSFYGTDANANNVAILSNPVEYKAPNSTEIVKFWNGENVFGNKDVTCKDLKVVAGTLQFPAGGTYYGNISFGDNTVSFDGIKAGTKGITISEGSVFISGDIDESADGSIVIVKGDAKLDADIPEGTTVEINSGATLVVPTGKEITNNGKIVNNGTISSVGTLKNAGTVEFTSTGKLSGNVISNADANPDNETPAGIVKVPAGTDTSTIVTGGTITTTDGTEDFGMKGELEADYPVTKSTFLAGDLTIPEGKTLTIKGTLDLKGYSLTVKGKLVIESKGAIVGDISAPENIMKASRIVLSETGVIENKGMIGKNSTVTVTDKAFVEETELTDYRTVQMNNVTGAEFSLTKVTQKDSKPDYILTVSGNVSKKGDIYSFAASGVYISDLTVRDLAQIEDKNGNRTGSNAQFTDCTVIKDKSFTVGSKACANIVTGMTVLSGAVITVDGELSGNGNVTMYLGSTANINGSVANKFQAKTGANLTYDGDSRYVLDTDATKTANSFIGVDNLKGIVIDVTSKTYTVYNKATEENDSMTRQMLNVYGTPAFVEKEAKEGSITVTGIVYVPAGQELVLGDGMDVADDSTGTFVTEGTLSIVDGNADNVNYNGTSYSVTVTEDGKTPVTTDYYTTFDNAYAVIDTVDDKEITISGSYTFTKEYTVKAGQEIVFDDDENAEYRISKDGKITVEDEGTLGTNFFIADVANDAAAGIQGLLIVNDGGVCKPADGSYEVKSTDANDNITYSGAAWAIENAENGAVIDIVGPVIFEEKITVPAGVTVKVSSEGSIDAQGGLAVNGKIENAGNIDITAGKNMDVAGTVENKDSGAVKFNGGTSELTVTGTYIGTATNVNVNAAQYQNSDNENVYTSIENAVDAVSKMDNPGTITLNGKFSEATDIVLAKEMKVELAQDAEVTVKSITLADRATVTVEKGTLTADIIGAVGVNDTTSATTDAIVDLSKVKGAEFTLRYNESNNTTTMTITEKTAYTGALKFEAGEVTFETSTAIQFGTEKTMSVASGATVVLTKENAEFKGDADKKYFVNEGTVKVEKATTFTGMIVGGNVVVKEDVILTLGQKTEITGTVTLSEKADKVASVDIVGEVYIGSVPETLGANGTLSGKVTFGADAYAIVFDGSTFNTNVKKTVYSTEYTINGVVFAKIVSTNDVEINKIDPIVQDLDDLVIPKDEHGVKKAIEWVDTDGKDAMDATVSKVDSVSVKLDYSTVTVKVSATPGLSVYIDDIETKGTQQIAIGTHTVTVYLDPNYQGTPVVTFNGKTINGSFEITTDMMDQENLISATGATYVAPGSGNGSSSGNDDGMSITDILLIVLVVLIVIMAVLVAIRMMRS